MAREVGVPGSGPSTTVGQVGEYARIVKYIQEADMDIKRMYLDWQFLWATFTGTTVLNQNTIDGAASNINWIVRDQTVINYGSSTSYRLEYCDWPVFNQRFLHGTQTAAAPSCITVNPSGNIRIGVKPSATYAGKDLYVEYYKKPVMMDADDDVSEIPKEFRRIIVTRAVLQWSAVEDAPEVQPIIAAEMDSLMHQMESLYLPLQSLRTLGAAERSGAMIQVFNP